jgi:heme exporter protein C
MTTSMRRLFAPLVLILMALFAYAPVYIAGAPYESTMGLVQKIFYFHVPAWFAMFTSVFVCGIASVLFLTSRDRKWDRLAMSAAELAFVFGLMGLVTGPLWGRKAWGVWWQWDARLTTALLLQMTFAAYLMLRGFAGPGSEKLAAGLAIFGMANVPFVYVSVNYWRTIHPQTTVVPNLVPGMRGPFWYSVGCFMLLYAALLMMRVRLEDQRTALDALYLESDQ